MSPLIILLSLLLNMDGLSERFPLLLLFLCLLLVPHLVVVFVVGLQHDLKHVVKEFILRL